MCDAYIEISQSTHKIDMVLAFSDQIVFNQATDENRFLSWVQSIGLSDDYEQGVGTMRCHRCSMIPSVVYHNSSVGKYHYAMRFICNPCESFWNVCKSCPTDNQPLQFVRYFRRQVINSRRVCLHTIQNELNGSLSCHSVCHPTETPMLSETDFRTDNTDNPVADVLIPPHIPHGMDIIVFHIISSMFDNEEMTLFRTKLKEAVIERETHNKYPDFLIKKYWLNNMNCSLFTEDVLLFFRYLRFIMKHSRDDNNEMSYIMSKVKEIKNNQHNIIHSKLEEQKKITQLSYNTIESLETLLQANGIEPNIDLDHVKQLLCGVSPDEVHESQTHIKLSLPVTIPHIRKILELPSSLLKNIPIPPVVFHPSGNAYVKPSDVLRLAICFGLPFEIVTGSIYNTDNLHPRSVYRAPVFKKLINESDIDDDAITVLYGFWSDGCYTGTESKGKRNQAKMTTIHIAHHHVSERHVFPIIFGKKGDDDDEVKKIIIEDMMVLSRSYIPCYIPSIKQVKKVRFVLGYAIQDRPEHAETTCFMGSGGTFSRQTSMSCPISIGVDDERSAYSLCKSLESCKVCWNKRIDFMDRRMYRDAEKSRRCCVCYDWDLSSVEYFHHDNFPTTSIPDSEVSSFNAGALKSKVITFETMKLACHIIFEKVKRGEWTQAVTEHFARRECIREQVWKRVWREAKDAITVNIEGNIENVGPDVTLFPPFWNQSLLPLSGFHLGVMHYLFLNVGKHLLEIVNLKLSEDGIWSKVYDIWNSDLLNVRQMSLSWCKGWTLGSSSVPTSMWVSENFVGFSILCRSMSSSLNTLSSAYEGISDVMEMLQTYYILCAIVMSPDEPDEDHCRYTGVAAKCLLSLVVDYCGKIRRHRINKIESTSCFVNLLTIGDKMKEYGIIRNYWEGGYRGEGIFRPLKSLVSRGLHTNKITYQVMKKQYQNLMINDLVRMKMEEKSYVSLMHHELLDLDTDDESELNPNDENEDNVLQGHSDRFRRFHSYTKLDEVLDKVRNKKSIALAYYTIDKEMYVFIGWKCQKKQMLKVELSEWSSVKKTHVCVPNIDPEVLDLEDVSNKATDYVSCIMLPYFYVTETEDEDETVMKYTVVNENHKELYDDMVFRTPRLCLEQKVLNERGNRMNDNDEELLRQATTICSEREQCLEFIGQRVSPIEDFVMGEVTNFMYKRSIVSVQTSIWEVKYYTNEDGEGYARKRVEMNYFELMNSLL